MARNPEDGRRRHPRDPGDRDADVRLWQQLARGIEPLRRRPGLVPEPGEEPGGDRATAPADGANPARKRPRPAPRRSPDRPEPRQWPELVPGAPAGVDRRTAERLRRGRVAVEARLDLHGMSRVEAHAALDRFITASHGLGRRCVLVITGKGLRGGGGTGVLRNELPRWLNGPGLRPKVVTVAPAQPRDGGGGAFYVYLRRTRDR